MLHFGPTRLTLPTSRTGRTFKTTQYPIRFRGFLFITLLLFSVFVSPTQKPEETILISPRLAEQIDAVISYYRTHGQEDPLCQGDLARSRLKSLERLLQLMKSEKAPHHWTLERLHKQFKATPINARKPIRLTRYAAFSVKGHRQADLRHDSPLLELPIDEADMSEAEAETRRHDLLRFRYRRQEIIQGALPAELCRPLTWLTRYDFEQAQMQGSVQVVFENGEKVHFNVSRSNGRPWIKNRPPASQERYWFFRKTPGPLGYGLQAQWQLPIFSMAALAGDLQQYGLGALVVLKSADTVILAVLADTGGAFVDNVTQMDLFLGIMDSRKQFSRLNRSLPERFDAFILE